MPVSRRSLLSHSGIAALSASAAPELFATLANADPLATNSPTEGELFWKHLYSRTASRGPNKVANEEREVKIAQYSEQAGLRWAEDVAASELPSFDEDAVVTIELSGFRPGSRDKSQLSKVRFAQLHLSCQRVTGSEFLGPIVWAALATMFTSKANKLPSEQSLNWASLTGNQEQSPQAANGPRLTHIVLNQGAGHLSVNVTTTPSGSVLDRVLAATITGTRILTPLLGFPGIALPALQNFYTFYGQLERSRPENFLLNSAQKDVAVTKEGAKNELISANALRMIEGTYILVPKSQEEDLQKEMSKLVAQNGYLVERGSNASPDDRIAQAVPTVTYASLAVRVQPASSFPVSSTVTDPLLDSAPQSPGGSSKGKTGPAAPVKKHGGKDQDGNKP